MNLRFLGDALDYWKGAILSDLRSEKLLTNLRVDAMASDTWQPDDLALFSHLLRVRKGDFVSHRYHLCEQRQKYFAEISADGDLFLDPDTGIQTSPVKHLEHYLKPSELFEILGAKKDRIVAVYQHVSRVKTRRRVQRILSTLEHEKKGDFFCVSYESATVALLFFSHERKRAEGIQNYLCSLLGNHAAHRVGDWIH